MLLLRSSVALTTSSSILRSTTTLRAASTSFSFESRQDGCWRPTVNDVERISFGKPAKKKGTGSRGVPHRLNEDERFQFDLGRSNGFLQVAGSAWRSQRREAPILNTYRSLCDAKGQVSIVLHKQNDGIDELVIDLSPLRLPDTFESVAHRCLEEYAGGEVIFQVAETLNTDGSDNEDESAPVVDQEKVNDPWETRPIYQLPPFCVSWELPRSEAKTLGKKFAALFGTAEGKRASSKRPVGVKAGKSRRHGGYGIG
jgi:hypothetical protein